MAQLQQFRVLSSGRDAKMVCDLLQSHGIEAFCNGAREYSSVLTGSDFGRYEISVPEDHLAEANRILNSIPGAEADLTKSSTADFESSPSTELKRAVVHAAMANFLLPIVFNYSSLRALAKYVQLAPSSLKKWIWVAIVTILNLNSAFVVYFLAKAILN